MTHPTQRHDPRGLHERAISAALMLVESRGTPPLSMAEVARALSEPEDKLRAMFPDERALLIASAEQALVLLMDGCTRAVVQVDPADPMAQFLTLGDTYLDWADRHPAQFRLLTDGSMLDSQAIPSLRRYSTALADLMVRMLTRARDDGHLHPREDIALLVLSARCYVTGLARMVLDGRLRDWAPDRDPLQTAKHLTHDFVRRMARSSQPHMAGL